MSKHTPGKLELVLPEPWWEKHPFYKNIACVLRGASMLPGTLKDETWEVCAFDVGDKETPPDEIDKVVGEVQLANGRRLEACWNALANVPDPAAFVKAARELAVTTEAYHIRHPTNVPVGNCPLCSALSDFVAADARPGVTRKD